ncbi:MAG: hypothetical protein LBG05_04745 [Treponema sp.]|jgi:hypothetical protein|nr:hypothetical protein [Treponema sp.]
MKRLIITALLSVVASILFADGDADFYANQFNTAGTVVEQLAVVESAIEQNTDANAFYASALNRLLAEYPSIKTIQEFSAADTLAQTLVKVLGEAKYTDAALDVWRTVTVFSNSIVKAECLISLGAMQAVDFLPQVVQTLKDVNTRGPVNRLSGERIAYGAIVSLANYNDPSGYLPVFFAANGWYSSRVRKLASDTLPQLQDDPTDQLITAITDPAYTYEQKLLALQTLEKSSTSDANKAKAASTALAQGWRGSSPNQHIQRYIVLVRKLAISMIAQYGAPDENIAETLGYLNRSYRYGADEEEQFITIDAAAKIANDDAVKNLGTYITDINERHARKVFNKMDERRIRALIIGAGNTHNQNAKPYLQSVLGIDWTKPILKLAKQKMDEL